MTNKSNAAKLTFKHFRDALTRLASEEQAPHLIVIYGPNSYLRFRSIETIAKQYAAWGFDSERMNGNELNDAQLDLIFQDIPIFGNQRLFIIENLVPSSRQAKQLIKLLSHHSHGSHVVLQLNSSQLGASLDKLDSHCIPCYPPSPSELPSYIRSLAKKFHLSIGNDAARWLSEHVGNDLWKLENEIKNLSLIYSNAKDLNTEQLQTALGYMKEDHAFELETLILKGQIGKAINLVNQLLHRGEHPLAIVGIISNHCRKILQIQSLRQKGQPPAQIARALRLPLFVIQKLMAPLAPSRLSAYRRTITLCQQVDVMLKSSRISGEILIASLLLELTSAHPEAPDLALVRET